MEAAVLRRSEFVSRCEALLFAGCVGGPAVQELHSLFDVLDPEGLGIVRLSNFASLLGVGKTPECTGTCQNGACASSSVQNNTEHHLESSRSSGCDADSNLLTEEVIFTENSQAGACLISRCEGTICKILRDKGAALRHALLARCWPSSLPEWISSERADSLLQPFLTPSESSLLVDYAARTSRMYQTSSCGHGEVRVETFLSFSEACDEHILRVRLDALHGIKSLAASLSDSEMSEVFLRCLLYNDEGATESTRISYNSDRVFCESVDLVSSTLDITASFSISLSIAESFERFLSQMATTLPTKDLMTIEVCGMCSSGMRVLATASLSASDVCSYLPGCTVQEDSWLCWNTALELRGESVGHYGALCASVGYMRKPCLNEDALPYYLQTRLDGTSIVNVSLAENTLHDPNLFEAASSLDMSISFAWISFRASVLSGILSDWARQWCPVAEPSELSFSTFVTVRVCPDAQKRETNSHASNATITWLDAQPIPRDVVGANVLSDMSIEVKTNWQAQLLVRDFDDSTCLLLELWLRGKSLGLVSSNAEMRLAEKSVRLESCLAETSVEASLPCALHLSVPWHFKGEFLCEMDLKISPVVPNAVDSYDPPLVESANEPTPNELDASDTNTEDATSKQIEYRIALCEVWLSLTATQISVEECEPYFYVEILVCSSRDHAICHRVVPQKVTRIGDSWIRVDFDWCESTIMTNSCLDASAPPQILKVQLFTLGKQEGSKQAPIPLATSSCELPKEPSCSAEVLVNRWSPLLSFDSLRAHSYISGRSLFAIRSRRLSQTSWPHIELLRAPAELSLPLQEIPSLPLASWEELNEAGMGDIQAILGDSLCEQLCSCESALEEDDDDHCRCRGWVRIDAFEACLLAHNYETDVEFLKQIMCHGETSSKHYVPYKPLLNWIIIRVIGRLIRFDLKRLLQMLQTLDDRCSGAVPLLALQKALNAMPTYADILPRSLWSFILSWPPWNLTCDSLHGKFFDYLAFFNDLKISGLSNIDVLLGACDVDNPDSYTSCERVEDLQNGQPHLLLHVKRALHLPTIRHKCPNTYVTYTWQVADTAREASIEQVAPKGFVGRTEVIYHATCPAWDYSAFVALPCVRKGGLVIPYPSAFASLALRLCVWHVDLLAGDSGGLALGSAIVNLGPLLAGFEEVDGYFHINAEASRSEGFDQELSQGQLCIRVVPKSASLGKAQERHMQLEMDNAAFSWSSCHSSDLSARQQRSGLPSLKPSQGGSSALQQEAAEFLYDQEASDHSSLASFLDGGNFEESSLSLPISFGDISPGIVASSLGTIEAPKLSETELRISSRLSSLEMTFSTCKQTEEEQLDDIRERHSRNMADLEEVQRKLLSLSQDDFKLDLNSQSKPEVEDPFSSTLLADIDLSSIYDDLPTLQSVEALASMLMDHSCLPEEIKQSSSSAEMPPAAEWQFVEALSAGAEQPCALPSRLAPEEPPSEDHIPMPSVAHMAESISFPSYEKEVMSPTSNSSERVEPGRLNRSLGDGAFVESDIDGGEMSPSRDRSGAAQARAAHDNTDAIVHTERSQCSGVDVSIQTETNSPDRKSTIASLLHESPNVPQLAQRCQKANNPDVVSSQSPWSAMNTTAPMDTTLDVLETPRTDADSESTSVATTVVPRELRFRGKWSDKLDVETQRIARIMRGPCKIGDDSDGSSSTGSE